MNTLIEESPVERHSKDCGSSTFGDDRRLAELGVLYEITGTCAEIAYREDVEGFHLGQHRVVTFVLAKRSTRDRRCCALISDG